MRNGFDYAGSFPGVAPLESAGGTFVGRYAAFDHPRGIQLGEVEALTAANMDIISYYEESETWIQGGYGAGQRAGTVARQVWASVGQHTDVPLFLAADFDFTPEQVGPISQALDGLASVIGRQNTGIYGGVVPVHLMRSIGKAAYGVQAGAWRYRASSVGVTDPYGWSPLAQVRQDAYNLYINGTQADHLTALAGDFGQWRRNVVDVTTPVTGSPWNPNQWDHNPTIKMGMSGEPVGWVQFVLNTALNAKLAIESPPMFDIRTNHAVQAFQTYGHLTVDGVVGPSTWHLLGEYVARVHRYDQMPTLAYGATDVATKGKVHVLQQALNGVAVPGHTPIKVSGLFDVPTRDTVWQYQRNRHLAADAVAGPTTWNDLGRLLTSRGK